jgi:peptidoglycan/LPS O-acetylase OafA/YrhL
MPETGPSRVASPHIDGLDSLRGIAALLVVLHHVWLLGAIRPDSVWEWRLLRYSPLRMILEGRPPVILFFVLSGFVLAHALLRRQTGYRDFAIRRFTRIYPPFALAILVSAAGYALLDPGAMRPFSGWFGTLWQGGYRLPTVLGRLLMAGDGRDGLDPVIWSLVHELRIALLLPVLLWIGRRHWVALLAGSLAVQWLAAPFGIDAATGAACRTWLSCRPYWGSSLGDSFLVSTYFIVFFVLGIGIALHRARLGALLARLPVWAAPALLVAALGLLSGLPAADDLVFGAGAGLLILLALEGPGFGRALGIAPLPWLGRISYSLYLIHLPVFLAVIYGLPAVPAGLRVALLVPLSLLAAWLFHRAVEAPAQELGRLLTTRRGTTPPQPSGTRPRASARA